MLHAICSMACDLFSDKRNQGHNPGFFDGIRKTPLVTRTSPVSFRWIDLALRIHKAPDKIGVLEINFVHFALAKKTRFFFNFGDDIVFIIHTFHLARNMKHVTFCFMFHALGLKWHILNFYFVLFLIQIDGGYFLNGSGLRSCTGGS